MPSGDAPVNPERPIMGFDEALQLVDEHMARWVDGSSATLPQNLIGAVRYSLLGGGKRLRPALVVLCCQAVGGEARRAALTPAIAVEMIHCFSLIHDDLPAMDDDDLRRGKPTSHKQFGEAMAILAGDLLATWPYQIIADDPGLDATTRTALCAELAQASGAMIGGQVLDSIGGFDHEATDAARLERTHRMKTGALIRAACRMGALAGGADAPALGSLTRYGEAVGLMFQVVDDVLDVTQSTESLGKRAGKDEEAGKLTYPGVHGLNESRRLIGSLRVEAETLLAMFPAQRVQPLVDLTTRLANRTA